MVQQYTHFIVNILHVFRNHTIWDFNFKKKSYIFPDLLSDFFPCLLEGLFYIKFVRINHDYAIRYRKAPECIHYILDI